MMSKIIAFIIVLVLCAATYVASPLHAAWTLREAMKNGDSAYLSDTIEWPRVRETLRQSLTEFADPAPIAANTTIAGAIPRKGLWSRIKSYAARRAVDTMVDNYANPDGLPQLFTYGATYRTVVHGAPEEKTIANLPQRITEFWSRVHRAEFKSLTAFELEMQDKHTPDRRYTGLLELQGLTWKLTELRCTKTPPPEIVMADG